MNNVFGWQIQKLVCLGFVATVIVSAFGCSGSGSGPSTQQANDFSIDPENPASEFAQPWLQLRALVEQASRDVERGNLDEAIKKYTRVLRYPWPDTVNRRDLSELNAVFIICADRPS